MNAQFKSNFHVIPFQVFSLWIYLWCIYIAIVILTIKNFVFSTSNFIGISCVICSLWYLLFHDCIVFYQNHTSLIELSCLKKCLCTHSFYLGFFSPINSQNKLMGKRYEHSVILGKHWYIDFYKALSVSFCLSVAKVCERFTISSPALGSVKHFLVFAFLRRFFSFRCKEAKM